MRSMRAYVLSCLHTFTTDVEPRHNDTIWCARCGDYRQVGKPPASRYVVNCVSCKRLRNRDYGAAFVTAETRAVTHSLKYAGHRVTLTRDGERVSEFYHPAVPVVLD